MLRTVTKTSEGVGGGGSAENGGHLQGGIDARASDISGAGCRSMADVNKIPVLFWTITKRQGLHPKKKKKKKKKSKLKVLSELDDQSSLQMFIRLFIPHK